MPDGATAPLSPLAIGVAAALAEARRPGFRRAFG